ncbi:MAG TPA: hypothetical protein VKT28_15120 [Puia sp.]|nr:hypothetical protein [Puia sp.]
MKTFFKISTAAVIISIIVLACKKSVGNGTVSSSYYITYNANGVSKNFNNSIDVCAITDTNFFGQNIAMCVITGATSALPAEILQIDIIGDTSQLVSNTFIDTATNAGYTLLCIHGVPGNADYGAGPYVVDIPNNTNPFQITFNSVNNGVVSGSFQGNLYDSTGTKAYTITNGKFNLPIKRN